MGPVEGKVRGRERERGEAAEEEEDEEEEDSEVMDRDVVQVRQHLFLSFSVCKDLTTHSYTNCVKNQCTEY